MKIFNDLVKRKKIAQDVQEIIDSHFGKLAVSTIRNSNDKRAQKKLEQIISRLKATLKAYISREDLGVYGISKVLKLVQNHLINMGFESNLVKDIVESLMIR